MESAGGLDEDMNLRVGRWFKVDMVAMVSGISTICNTLIPMPDANSFPQARIWYFYSKNTLKTVFTNGLLHGTLTISAGFIISQKPKKICK